MGSALPGQAHLSKLAFVKSMEPRMGKGLIT